MNGLDPSASLSMIYLREFVAYGVRGQVRLRRRAAHMLRMHWSVCATDARDGVGHGRRATKPRSEGQDTRDGNPTPQIAHAAGGAA